MVLQQKMEMLDSLMEIEIAYNLLKTKSDADGDMHPLDAHYAKLNTHVEVIDKKTEEFELLKQYVKNTHAATHTQYDLEILEVRLMTSLVFLWKHLYSRSTPLYSFPS
jgi:poly [ADP-ribose] polymerase